MAALPRYLKRRSNGSYEVQKRINGKVKTKRLGQIALDEAKVLRWAYIQQWEEEELGKSQLRPRATPEAIRKMVQEYGEEGTQQYIWSLQEEHEADKELRKKPSHTVEELQIANRVLKGHLTIEEAHEQWMAENAQNYSARSQQTHAQAIKLLSSWMGDSQFVEDVTRRKAGEFVTHLLKEPNPRTKDGSPRSAETINKLISSYRQLWEFLRKKGIINENGQDLNPWDRQQVKTKKNTKDSEDTLPYNKVELKKLSKANLPAPFDDIWRVALYTGLRREELCRIETKDIKELGDEGIFYFEVRGTKTAAASRKMVLHPDIVGRVLKRVKDSPNGRLWWELKTTRKDGMLGDTMAKGYKRSVKDLKLNREKTRFASFRSNFATALKQAETYQPYLMELMGHKNSELAFSRYGLEGGIKARYAVICKADFMHPDLSAHE